MNYANFIVKILEKPKQRFFNSNISVTEILVKFSQIRKNNRGAIFKLSIWGNLAYEVAQYYQVNDYIVIEGYISLRENLSNQFTFVLDKHVEISVFKIYPFLLNNIEINNVDK